jgi:very-short-patch-repair endonuclease
MKAQTNQHIIRAKLPRQMRNAGTDAERVLWRRLQRRQIEPCKFRRQHPYGDYILDFVCLERRVIVELDGSQHADTVERDAKRTRWLEQANFVVLRFWNNDVSNNISGVLEVIQRTLQQRTTIPTQPSP